MATVTHSPVLKTAAVPGWEAGKLGVITRQFDFDNDANIGAYKFLNADTITLNLFDIPAGAMVLMASVTVDTVAAATNAVSATLKLNSTTLVTVSDCKSAGTSQMTAAVQKAGASAGTITFVPVVATGGGTTVNGKYTVTLVVALP